jgi:hypothetical protein
MSRFNERIWTETRGKTPAASVERTSWSLASLQPALSSGLPLSPARQSSQQSLQSVRTMFLFDRALLSIIPSLFGEGFLELNVALSGKLSLLLGNFLVNMMNSWNLPGFRASRVLLR